MTKWIEGIENPVVWAVMMEIDGQLQMCRAGCHPMIYVSLSTAKTQMRRLKNEGYVRPIAEGRRLDGGYYQAKKEKEK